MTYVLQRPDGFVQRGMLEEDDSLEETVARACDVAVGASGWKRYRITVDFDAPGDRPHVHMEIFAGWWQSWRFQMDQQHLTLRSMHLLMSLAALHAVPGRLRLVAERRSPS